MLYMIYCTLRFTGVQRHHSPSPQVRSARDLEYDALIERMQRRVFQAQLEEERAIRAHEERQAQYEADLHVLGQIGRDSRAMVSGQQRSASRVSSVHTPYTYTVYLF